ncbi:MAG: NGG1p interacting factor NIF3 [Bacillota bacterium]
MLLKDLYIMSVMLGIKADPRGEETVNNLLAELKEKYNELPEKEKSDYDPEELRNPYADTRILYGDEDLEVKKVLAGIDVEVAELLLAERLREKNIHFDLVIGHHPEGIALAGLYKVMNLQEDILAQLGVPINLAEGLLSGRISEVRRGLMPLNHNRSVDAARLLNIPYMCVHTPTDNLVAQYLQNFLNENEAKTLGKIVEVLKTIPEFNAAQKINAGPNIVVGSAEKRPGKVFVDMTGGTGGPEAMYEKLAHAGVGTVIVMHITDKHRKEAEKHYINVINAGHIASDSLGMNLYLDEIERAGIEVEVFAGLIRHKRV